MQRRSCRVSKAQSYKDLEIYQLAKKLAVEIHKMTLEELPKFEMYEEGQQIRRSAKSTGANIVEDYGRRRYKREFVHFLTYSVASCDETKYHLEILFGTGSLIKNRFEYFVSCYEELGKKIYNFRESVMKGHKS
ncbi:four helix bundle protein [bacterium]|nr:four helix bundle protein [bacterium]